MGQCPENWLSTNITNVKDDPADGFCEDFPSVPRPWLGDHPAGTGTDTGTGTGKGTGTGPVRH